jgi:hypothetical protein
LSLQEFKKRQRAGLIAESTSVLSIADPSDSIRCVGVSCGTR